MQRSIDTIVTLFRKVCRTIIAQDQSWPLIQHEASVFPMKFIRIRIVRPTSKSMYVIIILCSYTINVKTIVVLKFKFFILFHAIIKLTCLCFDGTKLLCLYRMLQFIQSNKC